MCNGKGDIYYQQLLKVSGELKEDNDEGEGGNEMVLKKKIPKDECLKALSREW